MDYPLSSNYNGYPLVQWNTNNSNKVCFFCEKDLYSDKEDKQAILSFNSCEHKYHIYCRFSSLSTFCEGCNSNNRKEEQEASAPSFEEEDNEQINNNNLTSFSAVNLAATTKTTSKPPRDKSKKLDNSKLKKLNSSYSKLFNNKSPLSLQLLKDTGLTIDHIILYDVNIEDLYHVFGVETWNELFLDLQFKKEHILRSDLFPVASLVKYYNIDYWVLKRDLQLNVQYLATKRFTADEMKALGLNFDILVNQENMIKDHLIIWNNISLHQWIKQMNARKEHFLSDGLCLNSSDIDRRLKWEFDQFTSILKIKEPEEIRYLYRDLKTLISLDDYGSSNSKDEIKKKTTPSSSHLFK